MSDKVGMSTEQLAWLRDPHLREYSDFMAGNPPTDPNRTCGCGRPGRWDAGPTWHGTQPGRMARCDWCVGPECFPL